MESEDKIKRQIFCSCGTIWFIILFIIGVINLLDSCNEQYTHICTNDIFKGNVYNIDFSCCSGGVGKGCHCNGHYKAYIYAEELNEFNVTISKCKYWYNTDTMDVSYKIGEHVTWLKQGTTESCITLSSANKLYLIGLAFTSAGILCCLFACYNYYCFKNKKQTIQTNLIESEV
jgi:hypothetical protein